MAAVRWRVPLIVVPGAGRVRCSLTSSVPVLSSLSPLESPLASADWFDDDRAAGVQCAGRMGDPVLAPLVLSQDEQHTLENWAKRRSTAQDLALRARIVLASAEGHNNIAVAAGWASAATRPPNGGPGSWPAGWTGWVTSRVRGAADDHRCPRGGGGGAHPGRGARGGHALVQTGAGQAGGDLADQRAPTGGRSGCSPGARKTSRSPRTRC